MVSDEKQQDTAAVGLTSSDPIVVRKWLAKHHRKQLNLLDKFLLEIRLGRLGATRGGSGGLGSGASGRDDTEEGGEGGESSSGGDPAAAGKNAQPKNTTTTTTSATPSSAAAPVDRRLVVLQTVELLKYMMGPTGWRTAAELMHLVRAVGSELHTAGGMRREPAIGNVIRRILAAVREEAQRETPPTEDSADPSLSGRKTSDSGGAGNRLSLDSILWALPQHVRNTGGSARSLAVHHGDHQRQSFKFDDGTAEQEFPPIFHKHRPELKQNIMEVVQEILSDLEDTYKNINEQATSHIQAGDVVLTCGRSKTTELFLKAAANKAKHRRQENPFQVIVCEGGGAGEGAGRTMAASLANAGIDTIIIPDSSIFAVMSRVNKVIIPAHAVLANGGLIASSGCNVVALAAHYHSVPVVCVTGIFKLCPMFPHEGQDTLNDLVCPSSVLRYADLKDVALRDVEFVNPVRDYIQPEHINLYVTNVGSFQPSFIYRLLAENYHSDDWELFE